MICADPWDETLRLEILLETELLRTDRRVSPRFRVGTSDRIGRATPSRALLPRRRNRFAERSTLGFLYAGYPYKIDHI